LTGAIAMAVLAVVAPGVTPPVPGLNAVRAEAAAAPTEELRSHVDRAIEVLRDPALAGEARARERRAAIREIATDIFDFEEMARRALARHWQRLDPEERREFVRLFTDVLEQAYIANIEQHHGEQMAYLGDDVDGDQATVRTRIVTERGTEIPVSYRMLRKDGRWRVYDVLIEGSSLVANYRSQFNRIIQTGSYRELAQRLRERLADQTG
jgi:phospholipid transport system substrate-binding protein